MEETTSPIEQPQPVRTQKDKKRLVIILLLAALLIALAGAVYLYLQLEGNKQTLAKTQTDKTALEKRLSAINEDASKTTPSSDKNSSGSLPVIVFSPGGLFTDAEKVEITTKMINPYTIWHKDQEETVVSIHVQQNTTTPTQYTVDAIYQDGVYEGFLYGSVDAASQDWWRPVCLDTCTFTNSFKDAFPQSAM